MLKISQFISFAGYSFLWGLLVVWGCSPKTIQTASIDESYYEDLSLYRPSYHRPEESTPEDSQEFVVRDVVVTHDQTDHIDTLLAILSDQNQALDHIQGFTVQIYSGSNRESANKARLDAFRALPGFEPEIRYVQPNFKVKVGKFVDRLEAQWVYSQLKSGFPQAIIVPEPISLKE